MTSERRRVLLLCGGASDEHEVSLASASNVLDAGGPLADWTVRVLDRTGRMLSPEESRARVATAKDGVPTRFAGPTDTDAAPSLIHGLAEYAPTDFDVIFPILHGPNGEDGTVQGALELFGAPYVGAGVLASAVSMDKILMKDVFAAHGLPQVAYRPYRRTDWHESREEILDELTQWSSTIFVKPANLGSSLGISRANDREELASAMDAAFKYDRRVIVERALQDAREIEVAVLGNEHPMFSMAGEILVEGDGFYDYETKYLSEGATLKVPTNLSDSELADLHELARRAYQAVDGAGLARIDAFLAADGRWHLNEINTMPGFTRRSMYPTLMQTVGVSYEQLIVQLLDLAVARAYANDQTKRTIP